jgi:single-strand DNA-binding protein
MNSFTLFAVGNLAEDPTLTDKDGATFAKFALIGNDYAGKGREDQKTAVYFVAFNGVGETIARNARKGDQLILEAQIRANNWKDPQSGEMNYDYSFIVQSFRFGAPGKLKREALAQAN